MFKIVFRQLQSMAMQNAVQEAFRLGRMEAAQDAYGPLKIAISIIEILQTAVSTTPKTHWLSNLFEDDKFVEELRRLTNEFSRTTEENPRRDPNIAMQEFFVIYNLIDNDIANGRQIEAMEKVLEISQDLMERVTKFMKAKYPW